MRINRASFAVGMGSVILLGAALVPAMALAQTTDEPATQAEAAIDCAPGQHGPHGLRGAAGEDLAAALGVTTDELRAATRAAREATRPDEHPAEPPTAEEREALHQQFQAALAAELGINVDQLQATLDGLKAEKVAEAIERINTKVADGTLTQEQADAIIERIESGEPPFPGPRGPRHGGLGGPRFPLGGAGVTPDA